MTDLTDLESRCTAKWGPTQFDWVLGRTTRENREMWFWYCGTHQSPITGKVQWKHSGYSNTIAEALQAMIDIDD